MGRRELAGHRGYGDAGHETDTECAGSVLRVADAVLGGGGGGQQRLRFFAQLAAGRGEGDVPAGAGEQADAQFTFELADLAAQDGLGYVQPLCGRAEVQLIGDFREIPQLAQVKGHQASGLSLPSML